ncbi:site-specific integrase [Aromatoleum buckelii]|uniref:site-specific integrase n=1 Tax=Aromatoleum buckelii TaxID=200254 RepID=UPI003CCFF005
MRTEQAYVVWVKRYIIHHHRRHPNDMGKQERGAFQTSLAAERDVRAATQGQVLSAIPFTGRCWSASCHGWMR